MEKYRRKSKTNSNNLLPAKSVTWFFIDSLKLTQKGLRQLRSQFHSLGITNRVLWSSIEFIHRNRNNP